MTKRTLSRGAGWETYEVSNYGQMTAGEIANKIDCSNYGYVVLYREPNKLTIKIYTD